MLLSCCYSQWSFVWYMCLWVGGIGIVFIYVFVCVRASDRRIDVAYINIFIYSPTLFLPSSFLLQPFHIGLYCVHVISLSTSLFFTFQKDPLNGGKIITITHIIEASL